MLAAKILLKKARIYETIRNVTSHINVAEKTLLKPFKAIPGPTTIPVLGCTWNFIPGIGKYDGTSPSTYVKLQKEYGDIVRLQMPHFNLLLLFDPQLIREVFMRAGNLPLRPGMEALDKHRKNKPEVYSNSGLLVEHGIVWKELRSKVQKHTLRIDAIHSYAEAMSKVTNDFMERMKNYRRPNREINDFLNEVLKWGLESVGVIVLSRRLGCLADELSQDSEPQKVIDSILASFKALYRLEQGLGLWKYISTPSYRNLVGAQTCFEMIITNYLEEVVDDLKRGKANDTNNILNAILVENDMDVKKITAFVMDAFLAGVDTTAVTANFLLYELALNPDKQEKLYQQVCKVIPDKDAMITGEQLNQLLYLNACLKESMRLHPTTPGTARKIDYDIELDGYSIPARTHIAQLALITYRNKEYFPKPNEFLPERWLKSEVGKENLPYQFAYVPFGYGARMCIGSRIAEQEIRILVSKILQNFRVEYDGEPIGQQMGIVMVPDKPFRLKFYNR